MEDGLVAPGTSFVYHEEVRGTHEAHTACRIMPQPC
jgi:hypothetical protein